MRSSIAARQGVQPTATTGPSGLLVAVVLLRRLRVEMPLAASIVALILITSLGLAAAPRAFNAVSEAELRTAVAGAEVDQRNLEAGVGARLQGGRDVDSIVNGAALTFDQSLAPSIRSVIDHYTFVIDSVRYVFPAEANKHLTLRYQSGIERHVRVLAGRLPAATAQPGLEIAVSRDTADAIGVRLGQTLMLAADPSDRLVPYRGGPAAGSTALVVVGMIESLNPADDYWYADQRLQLPSVSTSLDQPPQIFGTALIAAAAYPDLLRATAPALVHYAYRYYVSPARFQANQADRLAADLRRLLATYSSQLSASATETSVTTGLADILSVYLRLRDLALTMLSLPGIGLLALIVAIIGLAAALVTARRRPGVALVRGRGGSALQLLGAQALEGVVLCGPAALGAYLMAQSLVAAEPSPWSLWAPVGLAVLASALLVAMAAPWARRSLGAIDRTEVRARPFSTRRLVLDGFVVALAAAATYLLRQRGLSGSAVGFDPFLAAAPALLGLAAGLLAMRLYGLPLGLVARMAAARRGAVVAVGLWGLARRPALAAVPLLVMLMAATVAIFASSMVTTIESGQVLTAWERVGADYRVEPFSDYQGLDPRLDLSRVRGVEATASAYRQDLGSVILFAVEPAAFERVTAGTPADAHVPAELQTGAGGSTVGSAVGPIPVITSSLSPAGTRLSPGQRFQLQALGRDLTLTVSQVRGSFAGLPTGRPFVVMPLAALQAAVPDSPPLRSELYLRAPASAEPAIRAELQRQYGNATLESRAAYYAQVHGGPLVAGTVYGFRAAVAAAALLAVLAVSAGLALTGRTTVREVAQLRVVGLSPVQVGGLLAAEQAPPALLGLGLGAGLGAVVGHVLGPGLDLTPFTGPGYPVSLLVDWEPVAAVAASLVAGVAVAVAVASALTARAGLGRVLKWEVT